MYVCNNLSDAQLQFMHMMALCYNFHCQWIALTG